MNAQEILDSIQNENIGSVIFRYSQGQDSTVGGAGYGGVCEGMCYNFVRVKLFQPNADFGPTTPLQAFRRNRAAGEIAGGVFVKDQSKVSPVTLTQTEKPGERQAASGVRFSQAARNLDAKFKKPLSEKAKETIADSVLNRMYSDSVLIEYTEFPAILELRSHMNARDRAAEEFSLKHFTTSHLAPLLSRDQIKETLITFGEIPISFLLLEEKEKQTPEQLGRLFASELEAVIKKENSPLRVLAICDVAKGQSGHAIAFEVCNPNGPISVLDPNFGLVSYKLWENFQHGLGKMWNLYRFTYDKYTLRRYRCLDPNKERDS